MTEAARWVRARPSAGLQSGRYQTSQGPAVCVKDFAASPKSKGTSLKSISQSCVLESAGRLEEAGAGQEGRGAAVRRLLQQQQEVMKTRQTPGWLEEP